MSDETRAKLRSAAWSFESVHSCQDEGEAFARELDAALTAHEQAVAAKNALHRISLSSQNSMSSKEECGRIAREVIPTLTAALAKPDAGEGKRHGCQCCGRVPVVGVTMEIGPFCREHWEPIKARAFEVQRINDELDAKPAYTPPPSVKVSAFDVTGEPIVPRSTIATHTQTLKN